ncbi:hypothetical protein G3N96_04615 [Burkholderia sp. Se-20373]|uniref:hypothetical protein n=1 Tax=Burkholderia sp. Se-20373 TaxID=2703898 RepID=UPI00197CC2A6|nr:hypothetical protein [Burkholderia sp. Se-20373]MBN3744717.1 hypothetical protein [Burkholderia sp. Se-20373]
MLADIKYIWKAQRASVFMFVTSLFWLLVSAIGMVEQFSSGHLLFGTILALMVIVFASFALMVGVTQLAVARQRRSAGTIS